MVYLDQNLILPIAQGGIMKIEYGSVVVTQGGRLGICTGHVKHGVVLVPIMPRQETQYHYHLPLEGVEWEDPEAATPGIVSVKFPYAWPESAVVVVGSCSDDMMSLILKAMIRELDVDGFPPPVMGIVPQDLRHATAIAA
jgi:hypothetical protein